MFYELIYDVQIMGKDQKEDSISEDPEHVQCYESKIFFNQTKEYLSSKSKSIYHIGLLWWHLEADLDSQPQ